MPTSIQSYTTYIPRIQNNFNQDNIQIDKTYIKQLNIEEFQSSTNHFIYLPNKKGKRIKILIGLSIFGGLLLLLLCILIPILIGKSQLTTTSTLSSSSSSLSNIIILNWNKTGETSMGITGQSGVGSNQLQRPFGLFIDSFNSLYISDAANHRIQKYIYNSSIGITVAGQSNGVLGTGSNYFRYCSDVFLDLNGNIYISDILNSRIQLWLNGSSTGTTSFGTGINGNGNNSLNTPYGITFDSLNNKVYVSDSSNNRIISYTIGSSIGIVVAGGNGNGSGINQLSRPAGIYFDSSTNSLFIANSAANNIVQWIIGQNSWILIAGNLNGSSGSSSYELNFPNDVYLDSYKNIYVADTNNHRIQFYYSGQKNGQTIAGINNILGSNATLLNYPRSITLDYQFNLYVADTENHRIQKYYSY